MKGRNPWGDCLPTTSLLHILSHILQVVYMGVALYAPSLALNAGEESWSLTPGLGRLENAVRKGRQRG